MLISTVSIVLDRGMSYAIDATNTQKYLVIIETMLSGFIVRFLLFLPSCYRAAHQWSYRITQSDLKLVPIEWHKSALQKYNFQFEMGDFVRVALKIWPFHFAFYLTLKWCATVLLFTI